MIDGPIVVTGSAGFIGSALCRHLAARKNAVRAWVCARRTGADDDPRIRVVGDLAQTPDEVLDAELDGARAVVHLAARVHMMRESPRMPVETYRPANVVATTRLASAAARAGIERFIFLSSVKVLGEDTTPERPFGDQDPPAPKDGYAQSKWEAEQALAVIAHQMDLAVAILRPVLVYGPGVGGNFLRLWRAVAHGVPLPLARVQNRRNLMYVGNLVHAIVALLDVQKPARGTWLAADPEALSTPELARHIAAALGVRAHLIPLPASWLAGAAVVTGRQAAWARLAGSLTVNPAGLLAHVGPPPYSLVQGLAATAKWWMTPTSRALT